MTTINLSSLSVEDAKLLNSIARRTREPFNVLVSDVLKGREADLSWVFSPVASRNAYISELYTDCCRLALIDEYLRKGIKIDGVITSSREMKKCLASYFKKRHLSVPIACDARSGSQIKFSMRSCCLALILLFIGLKKLVLCKMYFKRPLTPSYPVTLLDTFLLESSFGADGVYSDRYYGGILDYLDEEEKKHLYYLPTFYGIKDYLMLMRNIRKSGINFLLKENFLKISDYFWAFFSLWRIRRNKVSRAVSFLGFEVSALVDRDNRLNAINSSSMSGLLNIRFVSRLKERGWNVRLVIDWFENQLIDRGLVLGFHQYYIGTPVTGYRGYLISSLFNIYLNTTELEKAMRVTPDRIVVVGKGLVSDAGEFCKNLDIRTGPAFRFSGVWKERENVPSKEFFTAFVPLPISKQESKELINIMIAVARAGALDKKVRFWLKPHPATDQRFFERFFKKGLPINISVVFGSFENFIEKSDLLISNASSVCVQALACGVPVLIIGSTTWLTQNPIPESVDKRMWKICYTADDVFLEIDRFIASKTNLQDYVKIANSVKNSLFEKVSRESVRDLLRI